MGRPLKKVDAKRVIELAAKGHTMQEIAAFENVSHDTLERRFAAQCEKGRQLFRGQLRAKQFEKAMGGSDTMLIWLGKQELGQFDRHYDAMGPGAQPIQVNVHFHGSSAQADRQLEDVTEHVTEVARTSSGRQLTASSGHDGVTDMRVDSLSPASSDNATDVITPQSDAVSR